MRLVTLVILFVFTACSTISKSRFYGAASGVLICGTLGAYLGKELSPNNESDIFNENMGAVMGAGLCGLGGYYLGENSFKDDPENFETEPINFKSKEREINTQESLNTNLGNIDLSDLAYKESGYAKIPLIEDLPKELRSKVKKQKIIKYKIDPQLIKTKDGRTLYFSGGDAIEHQYQSQ